MGLDMYLEAEAYVVHYSHGEPESEQHRKARELSDQLGLPPDNVDVGNYGMIQVVVHAGYWRKANAIHRWFVENVQEGNDQCQRSWVPREKLVELRDACQLVLRASKTEEGRIHTSTMYTKEGKTEVYEAGQVVANPEIAQEHLPAASGFFFGSTDYDEWYLKDLEHTVKVCDRCLACPEAIEFHYRASW